MIEVKNLYKKYDGDYVLNDVSVHFEPGKCNLIIGRSGSGKTVLLKSIAGLIEVDAGEIWYDDQKFSHMDAKSRQEIRKEMGVLFQGAALFDSLTVEENVLFPLDMFTFQSKGEKLDRANFCLERVRVSGTNEMYPAELSGGMKKRVAIARAIVNKPPLILADEPTGNLDSNTATGIMELLKSLNKDGHTIIMVTHNQKMSEYASRTINIVDGEAFA